MRPVAIVGVGMCKFGKYKGSLDDMMVEVATKALADAKMSEKDADTVYVANMGAGAINRQTAIASALIDRLGMVGNTSAVSVENGPASGANAVKLAAMEVASGFANSALVVGAEKMRAAEGSIVTDFVAMMTRPDAEYIHGVTLPSHAAMFARLHMAKYNVEPRHLAMVAIKNQNNGLLNPYAHIQQKITMEGILTLPEAKMNNPYVAEPLRLYDMCPVSDGAAAAVIVPLEDAKKYNDTPVKIAGMGQGTDLQTVHQRKDPLDLKAVRIASDNAFKMAKLERKDMDLLELHDAFTILEIAESEAAGFFKPGTGHKALEEGITEIGGKLPINASGGLKARGHPVGATGVAQLAELTFQLRGEAGKRQIAKAEKGFAINFGGFGNNVVATILTRP
ncbi:MAG: acetyl-CoA acetyltransferase [Thermoplasmata archaeon]